MGPPRTAGPLTCSLPRSQAHGECTAEVHRAGSRNARQARGGIENRVTKRPGLGSRPSEGEHPQLDRSDGQGLPTPRGVATAHAGGEAPRWGARQNTAGPPWSPQRTDPPTWRVAVDPELAGYPALAHRVMPRAMCADRSTDRPTADVPPPGSRTPDALTRAASLREIQEGAGLPSPSLPPAGPGMSRPRKAA